jgi:hypothetical protein
MGLYFYTFLILGCCIYLGTSALPEDLPLEVRIRQASNFHIESIIKVVLVGWEGDGEGEVLIDAKQLRKQLDVVSESSNPVFVRSGIHEVIQNEFLSPQKHLPISRRILYSVKHAKR